MVMPSQGTLKKGTLKKGTPNLATLSLAMPSLATPKKVTRVITYWVPAWSTDARLAAAPHAESPVKLAY